MPSFRPCYGCTQRKDCDIKRGVLAALRGQPVTAAKIRCDLPFTKFFPPGTRVITTVYDGRAWSDSEEGTPAEAADATVIGPSTKKAGKLLMYLDEPIQLGVGDATKMTRFSTAWPKDVRLLDEPVSKMCGDCKLPIEIKGEFHRCDNVPHNSP